MEFNCRTALTLCVITTLIFGDSAFVVHPSPPSWTSRLQVRQLRQSLHTPVREKLIKGRVDLHFQNGGEDAFCDRGSSPPPVMLYGESRETWSFNDQSVEGVQIVLKNEGYPVHAELDVWEGPYFTPQRIEMYSENGQLYPFCAIVETPNGQHAIGISNNGKLMDRGQIADPLIAGVKADNSVGPTSDTKPDFIEGGSVQSFTFPPSVSSVRILLQTEGFPMDAKVELLQGDNEEVKQVVNVFSEDGMKNPLFTMMSTPGKKSIIRVQNKGSPHFPGIIACVEPYLIDAVDVSANDGDDDTVTKEDPQESKIKVVQAELIVEDDFVQQKPELHKQDEFSSYARTYDQPGHPTFADMYGHSPHPSDHGIFEPQDYPSATGVYEPQSYPRKLQCTYHIGVRWKPKCTTRQGRDSKKMSLVHPFMKMHHHPCTMTYCTMIPLRTYTMHPCVSLTTIKGMRIVASASGPNTFTTRHMSVFITRTYTTIHRLVRRINSRLVKRWVSMLLPLFRQFWE